MENQADSIKIITDLVIDMVEELEKDPYQIPTGISARHVHLSKEHLEELFGKGHELTFFKPLSQRGQFAAAETVDITGPKGTIQKVRILGPKRTQSQVEVAVSDSRILGIKPPVRDSGDLYGTPGITLKGPAGEVKLDTGVIVAARHIHMNPEDAKWFGVSDGDLVEVRIQGPKNGCMSDVTIRVSDLFQLDFHIDVDDANAFLLTQGQKVTLNVL